MKEQKNNMAKGNTKEGDTMAATARNFVYEIKMDKNRKNVEEPTVSEEFLKECRKIAEKYRKK